MKNEIKKILDHWKDNQNKHFQGIPLCPELVYRITGDWQGWNHFLGVKLENKDYIKNIERDKLENEAYKIFKER